MTSKIEKIALSVSLASLLGFGTGYLLDNQKVKDWSLNIGLASIIYYAGYKHGEERLLSDRPSESKI